MNHRSLSALVALNVALLAALVVVLFSPRVDAQGIGGSAGQYLAIAGDVQGRAQQAAVYIVDRSTGRLAVIFFNTSNNNLEVMGSRNVGEDLSRPRRSR